MNSRILTFIEPHGGARGPDSRLGRDPGYAFQGGGWRPRSQSKIVNGVHKIVNGGHNCERRSQNRQNKYEFYSSYRFLTVSFLLFKHASHPRSLLP